MRHWSSVPGIHGIEAENVIDDVETDALVADGLAKGVACAGCRVVIHALGKG